MVKTESRFNVAFVGVQTTAQNRTCKDNRVLAISAVIGKNKFSRWVMPAKGEVVHYCVQKKLRVYPENGKLLRLENNGTETVLTAAPAKKVLRKFVNFLKNPLDYQGKCPSEVKPVVLVVRGDRRVFEALLADMDPEDKIVPKGLIVGVVDGSKIIRRVMGLPKPQPPRSMPLDTISRKFLHKAVPKKEKFKRPPIMAEAEILRDSFEKMVEDQGLSLLGVVTKHMRKRKNIMAKSKEYVELSSDEDEMEDEDRKGKPLSEKMPKSKELIDPSSDEDEVEEEGRKGKGRSQKIEISDTSSDEDEMELEA